MGSLPQVSAKQCTASAVKRVEPLVESIPLPTYDGGCLGQIPIFPLQRDTSYLANKFFHKSWDVTAQGEKRTFYCKGKYGAIAPNGYTQDVLVSACSFAIEHGGPALVPASFYRFAKLKGVTPCRSHRDSVIRAFRSTNMTLVTNAIYDPVGANWETIEIQSIISSFAYEDENGRYRERYLTKTGDQGESAIVKSEEHVKKLRRFSIDPEYYRHFVGDGKVRFDLNAYFHMENPTSKRAYLNLCSSLQLFGGQETAFKTYLMLLGKDAAYVAQRTDRELQTLVTPDLERVNQLGIGRILVEKSPTGLRAITAPSKKPLSLAPDLKNFSPFERRTIRELCRAGLFANIAKTFVVRFSQALRRDLLSYTEFVIRQETNRAKARLANKTARVTDLRKHVGSNLSKAFCLDPDSVHDGKRLGDHWHYAAWREWQSKQKSKGYVLNAQVAEASKRIGSKVHTAICKLHAYSPHQLTFDLAEFRRTHQEPFFRILTAVHKLYPLVFDSTLNNAGKLEHTAYIQKQRDEALFDYCKQCHEAVLQGHDDFFPQDLKS